jgi:hypothetical protein
MTPADISPEYRAALEREAAAALNEAGTVEAPKPAIRAIDAPPQPPMSWLVRDLWPDRQIGLFVGDGGAFKSSAALHIACAVAGGYPVFERYTVEAARPVLIVSAEDDLAVVLMRLEAFIAGHEWDRGRVMSNIHIIADGEPSLGEAVWKLHLLAEVERLQPGFIILDPWAELMGGDENSNTDARPAIKYLRRLATISGAGVAVVHHAGKQGQQEKRALDRIRGASAVPSAARVILFFEWRPDGVFVENLKMSRAPRLEPFLIRREIETLPGNLAQWTSAKLTLLAALPFAETWVIERLRESKDKERGPTSTLLRELGKGVSGLRNQDIDRALQKLEFRAIVAWDKGSKGQKYWRLCDPNYRPPQLELVRSDDLDAQDAQPAPRNRGTHRTSMDVQDAQPAPRDRGIRRPVDAPLKGGHPSTGLVTGTARTDDPWADAGYLPDDIDAENDERRGMREQ